MLAASLSTPKPRTTEDKLMQTWRVELYKDGARMEILIEARSQREARELGALRVGRESGYRVTNAQQV